MQLNEAEIQVLAGLVEAAEANAKTDQATLETRASRFGAYKVDWTGAFDSLLSLGLIESLDLPEESVSYRLTDRGIPIARRLHRERPNLSWYHYNQIYTKAHASEAHSRFCEKVYGQDLCQDGQTDIPTLEMLIRQLKIEPSHHLLDVGCGTGGNSAFIAERTGATVTGIDISSSAMEIAKRVHGSRNSNLSFVQADMKDVASVSGPHDGVLCIDAISWAPDTLAAVRSMLGSLRAGGQLCIVSEQHEGGETSTASPKIDTILEQLCDSYEREDITHSLLPFWSRVIDTARSLRESYDREGNLALCDMWINNAEQRYLPGIRRGDIKRFIYLARKSI